MKTKSGTWRTNRGTVAIAVLLIAVIALLGASVAPTLAGRGGGHRIIQENGAPVAQNGIVGDTVIVKLAGMDPRSGGLKALSTLEAVNARKATLQAMGSQALAAANVKVRDMKVLPYLGMAIVKVDEDSKEAAGRLKKVANVQWAVPDTIRKLYMEVNDPMASSQWALDTLGARQAWDTTTGGSGNIVAVLDTGLTPSHEDLAAKVWVNPGEIPGNSVDDDGNGYIDDVNGWHTGFFTMNNDIVDLHGHGTHVAGIIGATTNNAKGVAGTAPSVTVLPVRVSDGSSDSFNDENVILAVEYLLALRTQGVAIKAVNMSFGGTQYNHAEYTALQALADTGVLLFAAAGNEGADNDLHGCYPAGMAISRLVTVGASTSAGALASFSNHGKATVDVVAPGSSILSTTMDGGYGTMSGTSMATPAAAAVGALAWAAHPGASPEDVKALLMASSNQEASMADKSLSDGQLSAASAVTAALPTDPMIQKVKNNSTGPWRGRNINAVTQGDSITLFGSRFGGANGTVTVGGKSAAVSSWTDTAIQMTVPGVFSTGNESGRNVTLTVTTADDRAISRVLDYVAVPATVAHTYNPGPSDGYAERPWSGSFYWAWAPQVADGDAVYGYMRQWTAEAGGQRIGFGKIVDGEPAMVAHFAADTSVEGIANIGKPMPFAVLNGYAYIFGGGNRYDGSNNFNIYRIDLNSGAITTPRTLPSDYTAGETMGIATATDGTYIYLAGGSSGAIYVNDALEPTRVASAISTIYRWNPSTDQWTTINAAWTPRYDAKMFFHDGYLVIVGGLGTNAADSQRIEAVNVETGAVVRSTIPDGLGGGLLAFAGMHGNALVMAGQNHCVNGWDHGKIFTMDYVGNGVFESASQPASAFPLGTDAWACDYEPNINSAWLWMADDGLHCFQHDPASINPLDGTQDFKDLVIAGLPNGERPGMTYDPANGASVTAASATLSWTYSGNLGEATYDVWFGDGPTTMSRVLTATSNLSYSASDLADETQYYWRVDVNAGGRTYTGTANAFTVHLPAPTVTASSPAADAVIDGTEADFGWSPSDSEAVCDLYLGTSDNPSLYASNLTEGSYHATGLSRGTTYYWKVVAKVGTKTGETTVRSFRTTAVAPVLSPSEPGDGDAKVNVTGLTWTCSNYTTGITYDVWFAKSGDTLAKIATGITATSADLVTAGLTPLEHHTNYVWRVDSHVGSDNFTGTEWGFHNDQSGPVVQGTPADGATMTTADVTLTWTDVSPTPLPATYDVWFGIVGQAMTKVVDGAAEGSHNLTNLAGNTQYQWRVDSHTAGHDYTGAIWKFTVQFPAPVVTCSGPTTTVFGRDATLSWACTNYASGTTYDVYMTAPGGSEQTVATGTSDTSLAVENLVEGTYSWRVVAHHAGAADGTGDAWTFPVQWHKAVQTSPNDRATVTTTGVTLMWTCDDPAATFDVYFGDSDSFTEPYAQGLTAAQLAVSDLTDGTYYWRVDAHADGDELYEGTVRRFTVSTSSGGGGGGGGGCNAMAAGPLAFFFLLPLAGLLRKKR
jgi:subtilisin family serine protease